MKIINQVSEINHQANFHMHTWVSNNKEVVKTLPSNDTTNMKNIKLDLSTSTHSKYEKALGLRWETTTDMLKFNVNIQTVSPKLLEGKIIPTKREFLKVIMSIYDPLGFISPVTIKSKIILQDVWASGVKWDEKIQEAEFKAWKIWLNELLQVAKCSIPRCYTSKYGMKKVTELHIFCDASIKAYSAVAYWKFQFEDGTIETNIIISKSRVAPLKPISVPRLELQAALLGSRLARSIEAEHTIKADRRVFWSDSRTVLAWIKTNPKIYHTFVAHRLGEICELTNIAEWRWIPTNLNPADHATRSTSPRIDTNTEWFTGPALLKSENITLPNEDHFIDEDHLGEIEKERKSAVVLTCHAQPSIPEANRFSSWKRLLGSTACTLLAIEKWKRKRNTQLTVNHYTRAETSLFKEVQRQSFQKEISAIRKRNQVEKNSSIKSLMPKLDSDGLIRVCGRIPSNSRLEIENEPIILDGNHQITRLLIKEYHIRMKHGNNNTVINELRQRFWITKLRATLKSIVTKCVFCKLRREKPKTPLMGNLPEARLAYHLRPFTHCGVDYFGPMWVAVGRRREKRWGALFTCMTTRAIHLEIVHTLTSDSTLLALRRLIARRGQPRIMYSDNGTNFRGLDNELRAKLKTLDTEIQTKFAIENNIQWRFIPPDTPHMGGAWERMIRSVKVSLSIILREQAPREEVLLTLFAEIEQCVNSRPLTHVSLNPKDEEALTPNHFLIGTSSSQTLNSRFDMLAECNWSQWRKAQNFADAFWKRWLREYLPTLLPRQKWTTESNPLEIGDVVLIANTQEPRNSWPKGVIEKVYPGTDDRIRAVTVRTTKGTFIRSSNKLIRLIKASEVQGP
ncbi:uncharacterized protein LOC127291418 [Leptopilina boulardi]|uniref:uncharacterized protein LOC127291418 n=1 Tax=Leptopilina boulardi TaxID=63433 RepID=UPI0021F5FCB9|nr:uncharacterized protein LOC127291418 [Leptopilina boulardi]